MPFDPTAFLRLDALQSLGTSATGASFATSTGDILEVSCHGPGVFRLRVGPNTKPDYGLVVGRAKACTVAQGDDGTWPFTAGESTLELGAVPLRFRLLHRGAPVTGSITDEDFRGWTRLPTFGRLRQGGQWIAALALASGEPVYGLGEKFGPLDKRGQLVHSQVVDALGVNTGLSYKNAPFAWSPGTGKGAWGVFVNTPATVTHGVGHPDWSHRSYGLSRRRRGARPLPVRRGYARGHPRPVHAAHRPSGAGADVGPGPVGVARLLRDPGGSRRGGGEAARAPDPLRRADARRASGVERRDALRFRMGSRALSGSAGRARGDQGARPQDLRVGVPVRVGALAAVRGPRVARLSADQCRRRSLRVRLGHRAGRPAPSATC